LLPAVIEVGLALKLIVGGFVPPPPPLGFTVIVTCALTQPLPQAVSVYVRVLAGDVDCVPDVANTAPMPWLIIALVAFEIDQLKVELFTTVIVIGVAVKLFITVGFIPASTLGLTVMFTLSISLPTRHAI